MERTRAKKISAYGVGLNDAEYPVTKHEMVNGKRKIVWKCPIYVVWRSMLTRCYSYSYQSTKPTYAGCSVATEWHLFSVFRAWAITRHTAGSVLDKDLLHPGNKVYSPSTCCFISPRANGFVAENNEQRGEYPIGVSWHKKLRKLQARCCNPYNTARDYIGVFDCPDKAHMAWAAKKLEYAKLIAAEMADEHVALAIVHRFEQVYERAWRTCAALT